LSRIIPRKRFGQHFLTDEVVLDSIIKGFSPRRDDQVLEIGPGTGVLTGRLLDHLDHLTAIELDQNMVNHLNQRFSDRPLSILQQDILKTDIRSPEVSGENSNVRIIGNLPYNISTPLLFHIFDSLDIIQDMLFMIQKEVGLRLVAKAGNRNYGRLSVMAGLHVDSEILFDVEPESFSPQPKVTSSVIHMQPRHPAVEPRDPKKLEKLVKAAFSNRRKTLRNALSGMITGEQFKHAGIDDSLRPENLTPADYLHLSDMV